MDPGFRPCRPRDDSYAIILTYVVYIMASQKNGTLYIGVTNNIHERAYAHTQGRGAAFTSKYKIKRLVYVEHFDTIKDAIAREKELKKWRRQWKIELIEAANPDWDDVYSKLGP